METNHAVGDARTAEGTLDGLLAQLMDRIPGTVQVLLASGDGLKLAHTDKDINTADAMAAVMSGLNSLGGATFKGLPGGVRQVVVEHDAGALFVMSADAGATDPRVVGTVLGVVASPTADLGAVGFEMTRLITGLDEHLIVQARTNNFAGQGK
ncbi:roadblock/LC7 domain-containing protein [Streptomyces sp. NPDC020681]|uniref:roadblock/LC7 domain-containing protein n=1 Tax=Streptomyces sp. NPDC020681 TaxID=3365083 RepID=UPI0037B75A9D